MSEIYLVTGGAGFIGSALVRRLVGEGHKVVTLDALTYAGNIENLAKIKENKNHIFVRGDIGDGELVSGLLTEYSPRYVINVAAETHVDRSIDGPRQFIDTNIVGTSVLIDEVYRYWQKFENHLCPALRFIQVSTDEVFGSIRDGLFRETDPYRPNSPYAASKAAADHLVLSYWRTYKLPVVITHGSNTYGPYQFPEKLIPLIILNALAGKTLPVYGDGSNVRDWLYVDDHALGIAAIARQGRPGESYNIGGNTERTNLEVINSLCHLLDVIRPKPDGKLYGSQISYVPDRPGHDFRYALDITKASEETAWRPTMNFDRDLARTVDWYIANDSWCQSITETRYARQRLGIGRSSK